MVFSSGVSEAEMLLQMLFTLSLVGAQQAWELRFLSTLVTPVATEVRLIPVAASTHLTRKEGPHIEV